jgi:hypothetical protein
LQSRFLSTDEGKARHPSKHHWRATIPWAKIVSILGLHFLDCTGKGERHHQGVPASQREAMMLCPKQVELHLCCVKGKRLTSPRRTRRSNVNHGLFHQMLLFLSLTVSILLSPCTYHTPFARAATSKPVPPESDNNIRRALANRQVHTTVTAPSWPRSAESTPFCAIWCYLQEEQHFASSFVTSSSDGENESHEKRSSEWTYLDHVVNIFKEQNKDIDNSCSVGADGDETCSANNNQGIVPGSGLTYDHATEIALEAASRMFGESEGVAMSLLQYAALSLSSYSPTCELHRSLTRDVLNEAGLLHNMDKLPTSSTGTCPPSSSLDAFAIVYPGSILLTQVESLDAALKESSTQQLSGDDDDEQNTPFLLPNERLAHNDNPKVTLKVILYGQVASCAFREWYDVLKAKSQVSLLVRHMGDVTYDEEATTNPSDKKSYLQGYGVRLDIRNMDYNVFDAAKTKDTEDESNSDVEQAQHETDALRQIVDTSDSSSSNGHFVAGINLGTLLSRKAANGGDEIDENDPELRHLASSLLDIHRTQRQYEEYVPKYLFEKQLLSLQAATAIVAEADRNSLYTIRDIVQNIPSRARYLQQLEVPAQIRNDAESLFESLPYVQKSHGEGALSTSPSFSVFVNGKRAHMERPSFNMFEFVQTLREEQALLSSLSNLFPSSLNTQDSQHLIHQLIMSGGTPKDWARMLKTPNNSEIEASTIEQDQEDEDYNDEDEESSDSTAATADIRIDVGRGGKEAILYLNDIETDARYRSWSTSLQPLIYAGMGMGMGMGPPSIRRNLFTLLVVLDPLDPACPGFEAMDFATQLIQGGFPVRLGLVLVGDSDLKDHQTLVARGGSGDGRTSQQWQPSLEYQGFTDTLGAHHISEVVHLLIDEIGDGFMGLSILLSWKRYMEQSPAAAQQALTVEDWMSYYMDFVSQISREDYRFQQEARDMIKDQVGKAKQHFGTPRFIHKYRSALEFANLKRISPGDTFFNGRPLSAESPEAYQTVLSKEMSHLSQLVMQGEITEQK